MAVGLLGLGILVHHLRGREDLIAGGSLLEPLWLERPADLLAQMGLMLVGALGVRALLPGEDEEEEPDEPVG
jgi:hypothetical protein